MLLSGSLEAFRVQDLLGLVGRKPGQWLISVSSGPKHAHVALRDREVVSVSADEARQDLARRLVVEGAVGTTSLAEALRHANDNGLGLVRALVDSHKVETSEVEPMVRAHIVSALAALTHWRSGSFSADRVQDLPDDLGRGFPLTEIGPQISHLLQRWRPASDALGGPRTVMAVYPGPVPSHLGAARTDRRPPHRHRSHRGLRPWRDRHRRGSRGPDGFRLCCSSDRHSGCGRAAPGHAVRP